MSDKPHQLVELLLDRTTSNFEWRLYKTQSEKCFFWGALGSFVLGLGVSAIGRQWHCQSLAMLGAVIFLVGTVLMLMFFLLTLYADVRAFSNPERMATSKFGAQLDRDSDLIEEMVARFDAACLNLARRRFDAAARQMRERIALLFGPIEKLGVLPFVATGYFSYEKFLREGLQPFAWIEWLFVFLAFYYLLGLRAYGTAQWMERKVILCDLAIELQKTTAAKAD